MFLGLVPNSIGQLRDVCVGTVTERSLLFKWGNAPRSAAVDFEYPDGAQRSVFCGISRAAAAG